MSTLAAITFKKLLVDVFKEQFKVQGKMTGKQFSYIPTTLKPLPLLRLYGSRERAI